MKKLKIRISFSLVVYYSNKRLMYTFLISRYLFLFVYNSNRQNIYQSGVELIHHKYIRYLDLSTYFQLNLNWKLIDIIKTRKLQSKINESKDDLTSKTIFELQILLHRHFLTAKKLFTTSFYLVNQIPNQCSKMVPFFCFFGSNNIQILYLSSISQPWRNKWRKINNNHHNHNINFMNPWKQNP